MHSPSKLCGLLTSGNGDGGNGGGSENVGLCLMAETSQGRVLRSHGLVETRSDSVPQTSLSFSVLGEESRSRGWVQVRKGTRESSPLWQCLQNWLRVHMEETSVLTLLSFLILGPF